MSDAYMLHKAYFKWYITPTCEFLDELPVPNEYLCFWFRHNAEVVLSAMNAAFNEGYRFHTCFGDK